MTLTYTLKNPYPDSTVKELLEEHLLIPRKIRHFLRTKKHLLINGETTITHKKRFHLVIAS